MRLTGIVLCLSLYTCGAEEVGPTARIDLEPDTLCEGAPDTAVIVSGKGSLGRDGTSDGLAFAWSFSRQPGEILRGNTEEVEIVAKFSTTTPVQVRLEVTDPSAGTSVREVILGLTRAARVPCASGCATHEICAPFAGVELCVDDLECTEDSECGCLTCLSDDLGARRCVAP